MRRLALIFILNSSALLSGAGNSQLANLLDNQRFFDLRRALDQADSSADTSVYRGVVLCRFGHEGEGIDMLQRLLTSNPDHDTTVTIQRELAEAYERIGRYRDAAEAWSRWLKLAPPDDPDREENSNTQVLLKVVSDVPPQTVEFSSAPATGTFKSVRSKIGTRNAPVEINGVTAQWIFDTGANLTTLSESEAKRMGLIPRDSGAWVAGSTGKRTDLRVAVAKELDFGPARVHNVILLVLPDASLYIAPIHYQMTGILGLPVLRALGRVGITAGGAIRIHPPETKAATAPDLFFDGDSPIVEVSHGGHITQMFLDTGANDSALFASFRAALGAAGTAKLKRKTEKQGGVGGSISRSTEIIPRLQIEIGGTPVTLKKESLRSDPPSRGDRFRDGVIGMDALWGGYLLDFNAMRLELE